MKQSVVLPPQKYLYLWGMMSVFICFPENWRLLEFEKSGESPHIIYNKVVVLASKLVKNDTEYSVYVT